MKTKILLALLLIASMAYEASAHVKIIIRGGGPGRNYNYIKVTNRVIKCLNAGHAGCPADFGAAQESGVFYPLKDVTEYVFSQVEKGNTTGNIKYKNDLPVSWKVLEDKSIEIDVEENGTMGLEEYGIK